MQQGWTGGGASSGGRGGAAEEEEEEEGGAPFATGGGGNMHGALANLVRICASPPGLKGVRMAVKGWVTPDESILATPIGYHEVTVGDLLTDMENMHVIMSESPSR